MEVLEAQYTYAEQTPIHRVTRITFIVICCALMIALVFMLFNVYRLQKQVADLQADISKSHGVVLNEMTKVRELSSFMASTNRRTLKSIREELEEAKSEVQASAGETKQDAEQHVRKLERELREETNRERELQTTLKAHLADAQAIVSRADKGLADVHSEVGNVKNEMKATQSDLNRAVSDLRHVIGDLGVMSGLIATNQQELEVLKAVGDRTYTEFRLPKAKTPQNVSGVRLVLRKTDPGGRKYSMEVIADERRVQKIDRTVNEPVQFYVADRRKPYEIVVNRVEKNQVSGYLAIPKPEATAQ